MICSERTLTAKGKRTDIGQYFGETKGDTLRMKLDLKKYSLSYCINDKGKEHCIHNLDKKGYTLAVSLCKGRKLKLINAGFC